MNTPTELPIIVYPNPESIVLLTLLATSLTFDPDYGEAAIPTTVDPYLKKVTTIVANTLLVNLLMMF